jgi:putative PIN family toxin of toxin-antitoxin system
VRLVLDTNTALSGLIWDGPPARLIEASEAGKILLVTSVDLLAELRSVLSRNKFSLPLARRNLDRHTVFVYYLAMVIITAPAMITSTVIADPADDAVLAAGLGGRADLIVSGDAHLLNLKSFAGVDIVTAALAIERIAANP